jgi:2-polyprenyl-3-methyl-5-hydroxy-6-metoxy-1,4-benzoquinol methylase
MTPSGISEYQYGSSEADSSHVYVLPAIVRILNGMKWSGSKRIFDLGCGNGALAAELAKCGYDVTGVDPSESGIKHARRAHPQLQFDVGSCYDNLAKRYGRFPVVLCVGVIEHVYSPRSLVACIDSLLDDNGVTIILAPYHGYLKNLALSLTGRMDTHFTAQWEHGHIKFWSRKTLGAFLETHGFSIIEFHGVGRIPGFWKGMILVSRKTSI